MRLALLLMPCFLVGLSSGFLTGLSESPILGASLQAVLTLGAALMGFWLGSKGTANRDLERAGPAAWALATALVGMASGAVPGVILRSHAALEPAGRELTVLSCDASWPADVCVHLMTQDVLLDAVGVPEQAQIAWRDTLRNCDLREPIPAPEAQNDQRVTGATLAAAVKIGEPESGGASALADGTAAPSIARDACFVSESPATVVGRLQDTLDGINAWRTLEATGLGVKSK